MGWIKAENSMPSHPKILAANLGVSCTPGWLFVCGLCYANEHLTDGFIPIHVLPALAPGTKKVSAAVARLVAAQLWHEIEGGWIIHDYQDFQRSADAIRERRTADSARKAIARSNGNPRGLRADSRPSRARAPSLEVEVEVEENRREKVNTTVELRSTAKNLLDLWRAKCDHLGSRATKGRLGKIEARLKEGYTEEQIGTAIDGAARAPFVNDAGKRFDDIELICRNGEKLESFIERATMTPPLDPVLQRMNAWHDYDKD